MNRDSIKTAAGLVIIAGIVVVTFLYGNAQRQAQLAHDQKLQKQQQAKAAAASPAASASPAKAAATPARPAVAAASVTPTGTPAKASATPAPAGTVDGAQTAPAVIPDTGAGEDSLIGLSVLSLAGMYWLRSKRSVQKAIRVRV